MVKPSILVTRRWPLAVEQKMSEHYDVELNRSDRPLTSAEFRDAIATYDAVLPTTTDRICAASLDVPQARTKILANYGVGFNHIDVSAATERGIAITNTPDLVSECTADLAMTLMLMVARRTRDGERELRSGDWDGWRPTHLLGTKVSGKVLGIVGFDRVGQELARRAHHGFGMDIVVCHPTPVEASELAHFGARQVSALEDLLPVCDFVSLHGADAPEKRHMINSIRLNLMRDDAFLINTSRSDLINETALAQALMFDTIGGAALDVFDGEPRVHRLLSQCDNLVMLPHLGSATREAREAMGFRVLDNLNDFFEGSVPRDKVA